jgi:transposase-like protein
MRQGDRVLDEGPRGVSRLLRLPSRALKHLRTTNVIESAFATVRHRTVRSKMLSNKTALAMIFKFAEAAEKGWYRLDGQNQLLILSV